MNVQVKNTDLPPFRPLPQKAPSIEVRRKPDGTVYIDSNHKLGVLHRSIAHLFAERAGKHPMRNFIAERTPLEGGKTGDWRFITYGEAFARANAIAQALLSRGMNGETPLMILSGNSIVHATLTLGAMLAGVPVAPVSVAYSLMSGDHSKLKHVFGVAQPKMIFAEQGPIYARALAALPLDGVEIVTVMPIADRKTTAYDDLIRTNAGPALRLRSTRSITTPPRISLHLGLDRHAKTWSDPRMMCAVIAAQERCARMRPIPTRSTRV